MLSEKRKYNFVGELTLRRSSVLDSKHRPKDDQVNWLFLNTGEQQFSFVYKIENPLQANYGLPFKADLAFTAESAKDVIQLNHDYEVLRGQETVGTVKLTNAVE
jgi:hypothetical protein